MRRETETEGGTRGVGRGKGMEGNEVDSTEKKGGNRTGQFRYFV